MDGRKAASAAAADVSTDAMYDGVVYVMVHANWEIYERPLRDVKLSA